MFVFVTEKPRTIPLELHDTVNAPILQKKTQLVNMQSPPLVLSNLSPYRQDYGLASGNSMSRLTNLISLPRGQIYNGMKGAIQETHGIDPRQTLPIGFGYQESAGAVILPARRNRASSYYISPRNDARIRRGPHMVTSSSPARSMSLIPDSSVDPFAPEIRNLRLSQTGTPRLPHTQPLGLSQIRAPGLSNNNVNLMHSPRQTAQRTSSRLGPRAPRHFWNGRRMFPAQGRSPVWATSGGQVRDISVRLPFS